MIFEVFCRKEIGSLCKKFRQSEIKNRSFLKKKSKKLFFLKKYPRNSSFLNKTSMNFFMKNESPILVSMWP